MLIELPYGGNPVQVEVPDYADVVYPKELPGVINVRSEIRRAMDNPIGTMRLSQLAQGKSDAVVIINDFTRPAPSDHMLEETLVDLKKAGIPEDSVTVLIACGNHRPTTKEEIQHMLGRDLSVRLCIVNHDCQDENNLTFLGDTDRGLPVWVNSLVVNSSLKILTGLISPHHGAGYSGGRKSVTPGVAGMKTLRKHHSFPIRSYQPAIGWLKGNPFHEEAVKMARMAGIDFILNVVKTSSGEVIEAVAGELEAAHEKGVETCEKACVIALPHKYDIVIVTPGGYPRDIDLHQSQKALSIAELVVDKGGLIVLIAECPDGAGKFTEWLKRARSPKEVIERFTREGFTPEHSSKAFMCARALEEHTVIMSCSGIEKNELEQMFFRSSLSPQAAIDEALEIKGLDSRILVLPHAVNCMPNAQG